MDAQPRLLWQPSTALKSSAQLSQYLHWLASDERYRLTFPDYQSLWQWSVEEPAVFWESLWQYFSILSHTPYDTVMSGQMPHTQWFEGSTLNYAEHVFRQYTDARPAILFQSESQPLQEISWATLKKQVASLSAYLKSLGVQPGDCVAGFLPNIPEASVALLATMSIGAIWTSASPDFGVSSVVERFGQVAPKVLIAVTGYRYGGRFFDKTEEVVQLQSALPLLQQTILIPQSNDESLAIDQSVVWADTVTNQEAELAFTAVPFAHPLWVLYSSGTTGIPKAITHSHGGMLLEHLKYGHFHADIYPGERFFWFTTTGWMMWNFLHATLLAGATIVLYDGSPGFPNMGVLWKLVEQAKINHFGVSAAYVLACMKLEVKPSHYDLSALRAMGSTGSPLPPEGFDWIYQNVKADLWLGSMSGGTDVCTAFVGGNPLLPVYEGEIQCRALGCAMAAFDEEGHPLIDEVGEMVITQPMPCMPIYFWNDPDFSKYQASYFEVYPGVWRHGDWLKITPRNTLVILGRSDATLNRQGIRIGTSEIYRSVEKLTEIKDSLILHLEQTDGESWMPLFVTLKEAVELTAELKKKINQQIRSDYSPRHVPDAIFLAPDIPYTISGKKLELPVKKILQGKPLETAVNLGSVRNPDSLTFFQDFSREENK
jgi:acetoacetyl-CoA synthetase